MDKFFELKHSLDCVNISEEGLAKIVDYMNKRTKLKEVIDLNKIKSRVDDDRVYIYINRKQYIANTEKELIDKLYDVFFGKATLSISELFSDWMRYRRDELHTNNKTLKENLSLWKSMYSNADIMTIPIAKLTTQDWITFFRSQTQSGLITRKRFNDGKSILNGIYYYAIEKEIVSNNPLSLINYKSFKYKPENNKTDIYTMEERKRLLNFLLGQDNIYSLAIAFDFCVIARVGELKSLKWSDISSDFSSIRIQSQLLESQTMNDDLSFNPRTREDTLHVKGNTNVGFRDIPLTPIAKQILERVKELNPSRKYIFCVDNGTMTTGTFNRHLKKACEFLNIPYRSSHKIRFTVASLLYHNGIKPTILQQWLGHSTLAMTLHYLKAVDNNSEACNQMMSILA